MARGKRVCGQPGCPVLTGGSRCAEHQRQAEHARGARQQRGYDAEHDRLRRQWAPQVATGTVRCRRCGHRITPDDPWDLGHDDRDRTVWTGPEHARCNRVAGGRAAHGQIGHAGRGDPLLG